VRKYLLPLAMVAIVAAGGLAWRASLAEWFTTHFIFPQSGPTILPAGFSQITIPFELVNEHIFLRAQLNESRPLWFMLDTGDKFTIVDLDLAKELHLRLAGNLAVRGSGAQTTTGAFVKGTDFKVQGFAGFSEPVVLAVPLRGLSGRLGHDFDGIVGSEFIQNFVVEVDYPSRTLTLHNRDTFSYLGVGRSIPVHLTSSGHPVIEAAVEPKGMAEISGKFELDLGASGALELHSPFVAQYHLPGPNEPTVPDLGSAGTGGETSGRLGRVAFFRLGRYRFEGPPVVFSGDTSGSAAESATQGNIGEEILSRFRLFVDYAHDRIIFEPAATFAKPFERAFSGLQMEAEGQGYRTFRIKKISPNSPASFAGLEQNDLLSSVNGTSTSRLTLSDVLDALRESAPLELAIDRSGQTLIVHLKPQPLI